MNDHARGATSGATQCAGAGFPPPSAPPRAFFFLLDKAIMIDYDWDVDIQANDSKTK